MSVGLAMISRPAVLFCDEATSGLDSFNAHSVVAGARRLRQGEREHASRRATTPSNGIICRSAMPAHPPPPLRPFPFPAQRCAS